MKHSFLIPLYESLEITETFMANQIYLPRTALIASYMNTKPKIGKH